MQDLTPRMLADVGVARMLVLQLAIAGGGIARLPDVMVGDAIQRGELVPILTDWHHVEPVPLYATYPSGKNLSPKIRVMVDFLIEQFGSAPWRLTAKKAKRRVLSSKSA
jgi:DNA-binding transcriptional LysR family regulator